ncbi:serine/threonine protein kinase with two-component sensor domain [Microchaete diplosiphon NIES-3275]|uniref:sensor histidine kinase n=1 Tax=unclassified Tolypothrix TaxID=2649714 RepID=UPI000ACD7848|nr:MULTISPECIES: ATP-binding protein [unclassified Tolypothrix]BAY90617.1 serine/threonine protein kinase with two-component sensor domain [Microchaete diplosiphon NIES-3275]
MFFYFIERLEDSRHLDLLDSCDRFFDFQHPDYFTVIIAIADHGMGMSEQVKAKIFDHLFTTKAVGKGTGLGLAIARQIIVEKHNGILSVNSTPGEGTKFIITIPILTQTLAESRAKGLTTFFIVVLESHILERRSPENSPVALQEIFRIQ